MRAAFESLRVGLMVGIGGGVRSEEADVRLGNVVVDLPHKTHGGVRQYDFGKTTLDAFEHSGHLNASHDPARCGAADSFGGETRPQYAIRPLDTTGAHIRFQPSKRWPQRCVRSRIKS